MSGTHHSHVMREAIECGIARGWEDNRIVERTGATLRGVQAVRRLMDELAEVDSFDTTQPARRDRCYKGHRLTEDNLYRRANGNRECRTCRNDRARNRYAERAA